MCFHCHLSFFIFFPCFFLGTTFAAVSDAVGWIRNGFYYGKKDEKTSKNHAKSIQGGAARVHCGLCLGSPRWRAWHRSYRDLASIFSDLCGNMSCWGKIVRWDVFVFKGLKTKLLGAWRFTEVDVTCCHVLTFRHWGFRQSRTSWCSRWYGSRRILGRVGCTMRSLAGGFEGWEYGLEGRHVIDIVFCFFLWSDLKRKEQDKNKVRSTSTFFLPFYSMLWCNKM